EFVQEQAMGIKSAIDTTGSHVNLPPRPETGLLTAPTGANPALEGVAKGAVTAAGIAGAVIGVAAGVVEELVVQQQPEQKPVIVAPAQKPPERKTAIGQPGKPVAPVARAA